MPPTMSPVKGILRAWNKPPRPDSARAHKAVNLCMANLFLSASWMILNLNTNLELELEDFHLFEF